MKNLNTIYYRSFILTTGDPKRKQIIFLFYVIFELALQNCKIAKFLYTIKVRTKMKGGNGQFSTKNKKNYKYHLFLARRNVI